jgi:hypothetical protein
MSHEAAQHIYGTLLVHKCVEAHSLAFMTIFSLYDVDGNIQQL